MSKEKGLTINFGLGSLCTLLFVVFLVLKLCGVIAWSWWLVCLPLLIEVGLVVLALLIVGIVCLVAYCIAKKEENELF